MMLDEKRIDQSKNASPTLGGGGRVQGSMSLEGRLKHVAVSMLPPVVLPVLRRLRAMVDGPAEAPEWELYRDGSIGAAGWNVAAVAAAQTAKWFAFSEAISGKAPLGIAHEANPPYGQSDLAHALAMTYGYVLGRCAAAGGRLSVLDWGGGLGQYYLLARALLPEVDLEFHCKEVPVLASAGRALLPEVRFVQEDDEAFARSYDLVMASGSLHYADGWPEVLRRMGRSANRYVYVTRLPTTATAGSYRLLQRAHRYGYSTEYVGWVLNRSHFLEAASDCGLELVREFTIPERPAINGAPEPCEYRGFLLQPLRVS